MLAFSYFRIFSLLQTHCLGFIQVWELQLVSNACCIWLHFTILVKHSRWNTRVQGVILQNRIKLFFPLGTSMDKVIMKSACYRIVRKPAVNKINGKKSFDFLLLQWKIQHPLLLLNVRFCEFTTPETVKFHFFNENSYSGSTTSILTRLLNIR